MEDAESPSNETLRSAGVVLLVVALIGSGIVWYTGKDDNGATCALSSAGLGVIALSINHGQSAGRVAAKAAATGLAPIGCKMVIESMVKEPNEPVTVDVDQTGEQTFTGRELLDTSPPPQPSGLSVSQLIQCGRWQLYALRQMCYDGRIGPPSQLPQPFPQ